MTATDSVLAEIKAGDWVQVYAQVTDAHPHPEEVAVRFESHNEHYVGLVHRKFVTKADPPEGVALRCTSLVEWQPNTFVRCGGHEGHNDSHHATFGPPGMLSPNFVRWDDDQEHGYLEEK